MFVYYKSEEDGSAALSAGDSEADSQADKESLTLWQLFRTPHPPRGCPCGRPEPAGSQNPPHPHPLRGALAGGQDLLATGTRRVRTRRAATLAGGQDLLAAGTRRTRTRCGDAERLPVMNGTHHHVRHMETFYHVDAAYYGEDYTAHHHVRHMETFYRHLNKTSQNYVEETDYEKLEKINCRPDGGSPDDILLQPCPGRDPDQ